MKSKTRILFPSLLTIAFASHLHAAEVTWVGNTDANFNTGANWSTGFSPAGDDTLVFDTAGSSGTTLNDDLGTFTLGGIRFNSGAPAYTIGGNSFSVSANIGIVLDSASGVTQTINNNFSVGNVGATVTGAGDLTLGGIWSRTAGASRLNMDGTGVLTLSSAASFATNVGLNVNSGTVILENAASFRQNATVTGGLVKQTAANQIASASGSLMPTVNGGTLDLNGFGTKAAIKGTGGKIVNNGTSDVTLILSEVNSVASFGGTITDGTTNKIALVVRSSASNVFTQVLSGNNTYSGGTMLGENNVLHYGPETLSIASMKNIGKVGFRNLTFNGTNANSGTTFLQITGTEIANSSFDSLTFNTSTAAGFDIADSTHTFTLSTAVGSGSGGTFAKRGAGTLVLTGAANYTGVTRIYGGTLKVDYAGGGSLDNASAPTFAGGGTLYLLGATAQQLGNVAVNAGGGNLVVDGTGTTLTLGTVAPTAAGTTLDIKLVGSGNTVTTTTTTRTNGLLNGGARVTFRDNAGNIDFADITDPDTPHIIQAASYTGGMLPTSGGDPTLNYSQSDNASVTASESVNSVKLTTSTTGQALTIDGGQILTLTTGGLLFTGADAYSITGGTLKSGTATNSDLIVHQYGAGNLTISSEIANGTGISTLTKAGTGTLTLGGINTYTGQTFVNGGTLSISANDQLGPVATGAALNLHGGTLQATADLTLANGTSNKRAITIGGSGGGFDVTGSNTLTVSGVITATGQLTKSGTGTLLLAPAVNAPNFLTGGVRIEDGILGLSGANALNPVGGATSALVFGNSGTPTLQLNSRNASVSSLIASNTNAVVENIHATTAATLTVSNGADNTFAGIIRDGAAGTLGLTKSGCGTLTLNGTTSYTGSTSVFAGTLSLVGVSLASPITVNSDAALGFALGSPATSTSTVTFSGLTAKVKITGTPAAATLLTTTVPGGITGTPVLDPAIPGYALAIEDDNTTLKLKAGGGSSYSDWATTNGVPGQAANLDHDSDGVSNGVEYFLVGPNAVSTGFSPLPGITTVGTTRSVTWAKAADYSGNYGAGFIVESSTTLEAGSWTTENLGGNVTISGNNVTYTFPAGPVKTFARLRVTVP